MKLSGIDRTIGVYDNISENRIEDIPVHVTVEQLKQIVMENEDDPWFYDGYVLNEAQLEKLSTFMDKKISFDFTNHYYVLQCLGIYDWDM